MILVSQRYHEQTVLFAAMLQVVKHVEAAELGLEDEDEEDVGTKDPLWDRWNLVISFFSFFLKFYCPTI